MSKTVSNWVNVILFQLAWMAAVGGAARGMWWLGPTAVGLFAVLQIATSASARADAIVLIAAMLIGFCADSLLAYFGFVIYAAPFPSTQLAPLWIVALWANFALTLNHSLTWLQGRPLLAAALGAIGAPLSYFFAARTWHAVSLAEPIWITLGVIALSWTIVTPLLCQLAARLQRGRAALNAAISNAAMLS